MMSLRGCNMKVLLKLVAVWLFCGIVAAGLILGSWLGPQAARHLPERPMRYLIAAAGLGLATWLTFA